MQQFHSHKDSEIICHWYSNYQYVVGIPYQKDHLFTWVQLHYSYEAFSHFFLFISFYGIFPNVNEAVPY